MADFNAEEAAKSLDAFLTAAKPKYLVLGGYHSDSLVNLALLSHPAIQAVFKKHGFLDIDLEARHEFQPFADKVANGKMSPEELGAQATSAYKTAGDYQSELARPLYEARGKLIQTSQTNGINVHFVEAQGDLSQHIAMLHQQYKIDKVIQGTIERNINPWTTIANHLQYRAGKLLGNQDMMDNALRASTSANNQAIRNDSYAAEAVKDYTKARIAYENTLAVTIKSAGNDKPSVILYGANHIDLGKYLGAGTTVHVMLCRDHSDAVETAENVKSDLRFEIAGAQTPAGYLDLSTGELLDSMGKLQKLSPSSIASEEAYKPITPEIAQKAGAVSKATITENPTTYLPKKITDGQIIQK